MGDSPSDFDQRFPIHDTTTKHVLTKFQAASMKKFKKQLEDFGEEEYPKLVRLEELFKSVDSIILDDDEKIGFGAPKSKGRKMY
ncbi:hypothetical protein C0991_012350 [Blastosporella zonata]|nr:hypothetical protein C0991_012350 [Blastosporella zonata]